MKIFSQEEWCRMCHTSFTNEVEEILGTRCNPADNDVNMDECPEDAVCITDDQIDEIELAAEAWLFEADEEGSDDDRMAANAMIQFAHDLRKTAPNRSEIIRALALEGKS